MTNDNRQSSAQRGYGHRWRKARINYLTQHPLCRLCAEIGLSSAATIVDHIKPHKGDLKLFWRKTNWQPLCKRCHDAIKQRQEITGIIVGSTIDGEPTDKQHHWYAKR